MNLEYALKVLAFESIKSSGMDTKSREFELEVLAEEGRIERMIEYYYRIGDNNIHYEAFIKKFLLENYQAIIDGDEDFLGGFIEDTYDMVECYEDNDY